jgi:catechol 2,3-dioxygenase-like lactoylglutathione lyase family enzyme
MIDHVILGVDEFEASKEFYERALAPLGMGVVMAMPGGVGFGAEGKPSFWIADREPSGPVHVAFASPDRASVDAFHAAALAAGGRDHGKPGLRPHYHPTYYAAFVYDRDGNNIEAVCHRPE